MPSDRAIEFYNSGLQIAPEEPTLLINKAAALLGRGVDLYNSAIRFGDNDDRLKAIETAKKDFRQSAEVSTQTVKILKNKSSLELFILDSQANLKLSVYSNHAKSMRLLAAIADSTKADDALEAMHESIDLEPNQERKLKAQLNIGKMLLDTKSRQKAVIEYKKILNENPNNLNAPAGVGMALA